MKLDSRRHDLADIGLFRLDANLAAGDRAQVQQIVDDIGERARVARDGVSAVARFRLPEAPGLEQARPSEDRGQRSAQLVSERVQKLVLEPARTLGLDARRTLVLEQCPQFVNGLIHGGA